MKIIFQFNTPFTAVGTTYAGSILKKDVDLDFVPQIGTRVEIEGEVNLAVEHVCLSLTPDGPYVIVYLEGLPAPDSDGAKEMAEHYRSQGWRGA